MSKRKRKEKIIVLDRDDTISNFQGFLCSLANHILGTCITESDLTSWNWDNLDFEDANGNKINGKQLREIMERFESHGLYAILPALNDAPDALDIIRSRGYKIFILTARDEKYKEDTLLNDVREGIFYDEIIFDWDKVKVIKDLSKTYSIQAFVDDRAETIKAVYENCKVKQVYLINKAHNENVDLDEGVKRINTLYECIRDLKKVNK